MKARAFQVGPAWLAAAVAGAWAAQPLPAQEADNWVSFIRHSDGEYFYDPGSVERSGDSVRVRMRLVPFDHPNGWGAFIVDKSFDCAGQTATLIAGRGFTEEGELYRSVEVPEDMRRAEPLFAGSGEAPLYRLLCPQGRPLPEPEPPGPPPIAVAPGTARDCDCDEQNPPDDR